MMAFKKILKNESLSYLLSILFLIASFSVLYNVGLEGVNDFLIFLCITVFYFLFVTSFKSVFNTFRLPVLLGIVFFLGMLVRYISVIALNPDITSDWLAMYTGAQHIANGDFSDVQAMPYFDVNVYQLGYAAYMSLYVLVFNDPVVIIKSLNIIFSGFTAYFIYKISEIYFDSFVSSLSSAMFLFYAGGVVYASVLTNEHVAIMFFCSGFYLICKKELNFWPMFLAGVLIGLGNYFRPVGPVIILAFIFYSFLCIKSFQLRELSIVFKAIVALFLGYKAVFFFSSELFKFIGITEHMLVNRDPYWKFVLGFNSESTGQWSRSDNALINSLPISSERIEIEKALISDRLNDVSGVFKLMLDKMVLMWGGYNMTVFWAFVGNENGGLLKRILENIEIAQYFVTLCFASLGVFKGSLVKNSFYFLVLICLGYIAVHLFIEINTRYRYFLMPLVFILAANGVKSFMELCWVKSRVING